LFIDNNIEKIDAPQNKREPGYKNKPFLTEGFCGEEATK